jgi:predicted RNA-binding Zn-ribbon protein involved in translation (DUF1610 family)
MGVLENALKGFTFGQVQDAATLLKALEKHGISRSDFLAHVAEEKRRRVQARREIEKRRTEVEKRLPKCPTCGIAMILRPAGEDPKDGSHWTCPKCRFGKYDPRTVEEIQKSIGLD